MLKPTKSITARHLGHRRSNGIYQCLAASRGCPAQAGFDLGERLFNGREVWRVRWEKEQGAPARLHQVTNRLALMRRQVIQDDDLARLEGRCQHLTDVCLKDEGIHAAFNRPRRLDPFQGEGGKQGGGSAAVARYLAGSALPLGCPGVERSEGHMGTALIHKDQLPGIQLAYLLAPGSAGGFVSFAGCKRLFL
jgi:hypothetical protein